QNVCAQPDEMAYASEKTRNYEIGIKSQLLDRRLTLNGAVFYIDWQDPQVSGATLVGLSPITKNGEGAETKGFEVSFDAAVTADSVASLTALPSCSTQTRVFMSLSSLPGDYLAMPIDLSLFTSSSTSATLIPAWRLAGSVTFSVLIRGVTSTPKSAAVFCASGFDLAFMMFGRLA
ncbi:hypothetical protein LTR94_031436, partial [Friedmanniomyces endolithicus]